MTNPMPKKIINNNDRMIDLTPKRDGFENGYESPQGDGNEQVTSLIVQMEDSTTVNNNIDQQQN